MNQLQESISKCKVSGNVLSLPSISEGMLPNYNEVRAALLNAGAKYKKNTFVFPSDAQPYIDRLMGGEKVNIKKEFQFFGTPSILAKHLVELADIKKGHRILEPSAGQGAIVKEIFSLGSFVRQVDCCELMPENRSILNNIDGVLIIADDFLKIEHAKNTYDRIIANPPFSKNQDIDHIYKMYECLTPGGRIVTIASKHWQQSDRKKETLFTNWLTEINADVEEVASGEFKESGTNVATCIITIDKA